MRHVVKLCGTLLLSTALLVGCESLWIGYKTPNPLSCEAPGYGCPSDQVCNPQTRQCEPIATTMLDLAMSSGSDGGTPSSCTGAVAFACTSGSGSGMFCTQAPLSMGPLKRLHGTSESDIWAISQTRLARYNGTYWNPVTTCAATTGFVDVFSVSPSDVWFIEDRRVYRLLSQTLSEVPITIPAGVSLRAIYGISGKIFVAGSAGFLQKWDGTKWIDQSPGGTAALSSIWGPDEQNLWVVGESGTARYWNGTAWTPLPTGITTNLDSVFGSNASNVFASGPSGALFQLTSSTATAVPSGTTAWLVAGSLAGDGTGFVVGDKVTLRRSGGFSLLSPTEPPSKRMNTDVQAFSSNAAWAIGGSTGAVRSKWNGTLWFDSLDEILPVVRSLGASSQTTPSTVFAIGAGSDGKTYALTTDFVSTSKVVGLGGAGFVGNAVWVDPAPTGTTTAWAVGSSGGVYSYTSNIWTAASSGTSMDLYGICGASANQVVAVGHDAAEANGQMTGFNGSSWTAGGIITGSPLYDVACAGINVMAVGKDARVYDCASTCIANANFPPITGQTGYAIWITPSASGMGQDIWVAGSNGTLFRHQTGTNSRTPYTVTTQHLRHIFGKNHSDMYVVGDGGTVLKWNGSSFSVVKTDTAQRLQAGTVFPSGNSAFIGGPMAGWLHQIP